MMNVPYMTLLKYVGVPLAIAGGLYFLYATGYNNGVGAVEAERDADRAAQALIVAGLNGQLREKERVHGIETDRINASLVQSEEAFARYRERVGSDFAVSLRDSEQRAARYRALAESGAAQCSSLASHAARLDASLVEGRSVVDELRATVEHRDSQLRLLGSQITSDRQLYENYGTSSH